MSKELNLTEAERQIRLAHGLTSNSQSIANGSQISGQESAMLFQRQGSNVHKLNSNSSLAQFQNEDMQQIRLTQPEIMSKT